MIRPLLCCIFKVLFLKYTITIFMSVSGTHCFAPLKSKKRGNTLHFIIRADGLDASNGGGDLLRIPLIVAFVASLTSPAASPADHLSATSTLVPISRRPQAFLPSFVRAGVTLTSTAAFDDAVIGVGALRTFLANSFCKFAAL